MSYGKSARANYMIAHKGAETKNFMDDDFISDDDLLTFEVFLKYQGVPATATPEELKIFRGWFDEAMARRQSSPKVGLMKLQRVPGEQKYAVALREDSDLWLTMWVRCNHKGEIFIIYPRGDRDWDAHASYHLDGRLHQKSHGRVVMRAMKGQPLTAAFKGSEHLGIYAGHGKGSGAVCDRTVFDGVVIVEPGILGPVHGRVAVDLVEPGYEATWNEDETCQRFYLDLGGVHQREVFPRGDRPSVVITIQR
jgi:hypothetical protein